MSWPRVGTRYRAASDQRFVAAVAAPYQTQIPRGTLLEVARCDSVWDNAHSLIFEAYTIRADLRILDGPSQGIVISISTSGMFQGLEDDHDPFDELGWLEPMVESDPGIPLGEEHPGWVRSRCGHRHRLWVSPWDFAHKHIGQSFLSVEPVPANPIPDLTDALGPMVCLEPGTRVRVDAAIDDHSAGSDAYWGLFRCYVLTGPHAGSCMVLQGGRPDWSIPGGCVPAP